MYKTFEEIRKSLNVTQTQFAEMIGSTFRTYQGRLSGSQPEWKLEEVIKAAENNKGKIQVNTTLGEYYVSVTKVNK